MSLRSKSISGFAWSFADSLGNQGAQFVIGIVLARLLTPTDYGLVGMITVFIAISQTFIDSGFTQALIRKNDATQTDFSTVFYFNLFVGLSIYLILYLGASYISWFFNEPQLVELVKVLSITIIISSVAIVQRAKLIKSINFKLLTKISITSNISSGIIGIYLAYSGYGVWSIVWRTLLNNSFQTILLWLFNKWKPSLEFSKKSFNEMFSFGYKLLLSGLIYKIYINVYYFIIGKYFSPAELGLYSRADQFKNLFSANLNSTIERVSYPVLSTLQDEKERLKAGYKKVLKVTVFLSAVLMLGMAGIAKSLIIVLIGTKWIGAVEYLQLLCFVGMFYPLHSLNLNILNVKGRSDLFLKLEIIKIFLIIPEILIGIFIGIKAMIIMMILNQVIGYGINSQYSGQLISYSTFEQFKDVVASFVIALILGLLLYSLSLIVIISPFILLPLQVIFGFLFIVTIGEIFHIYEYYVIKEIILERLKKQ